MEVAGQMSPSAGGEWYSRSHKYSTAAAQQQHGDSVLMGLFLGLG